MAEEVLKKESSRNQLWGDEELGLMASFESTYVGRQVNQEIQFKLFNPRTIDSIKGCRRQPRYKKILEEYKSKLTKSKTAQQS